MNLFVLLYQYFVLRPYYSVRNAWPVWYGILNRPYRERWKRSAPTLRPWQERVVEELRANGIASTSLSEMFENTTFLSDLCAYAALTRETLGSKNRKKNFLFDYWPQKSTLDMESPFLRLALDERVRSVANAYLELTTRMNYLHLADTLPTENIEAIDSQQWHRDPEEARLCKMFLYLSEVDETAGPFTYIRGSAHGQKYGRLFPQKPPFGSYPNQELVAKSVDPDDIMMMTGSVGTVIFCDTSGLHKGGQATQKIRTMFTVFYSSPWWTEKPRYIVPTTVTKEKVSTDVAYALFLPGV